jgi:hypothetical protein
MRSPQHDVTAAPKAGPAAAETVSPQHKPVRAGDALLESQRRHGNRYVQRVIQAKLVLGRAGDRYEQEADRVASQVVTGSVPGGPVAVHHVPGGTGSAVDPAVAQEIQQARSGGQAVPGAIRERMEQATGADFSDVRIHADARADRFNDALESRAFTVGADVFVRRSEYRPGSARGDALLGHELTHTIQQGAARPRSSGPSLAMATPTVQRTGKKKTDEELVREILDAWVAYLASLGPEEKANVESLDGKDLSPALRKAYAWANVNSGESETAEWQMTRAFIAAESRVRESRRDAARGDKLAQFLAELDKADFYADKAVGGNGYLYRNVGPPVDPPLVIDQGEIRGRLTMGDGAATLRELFNSGIDSVIATYVHSNDLMANGKALACMSACPEANSNLGRSPLWEFAFPTPDLKVVAKGTLTAELGVTALEVDKLGKTDWTVRTDSGGVTDAQIIALVCSARAKEHVLLTTVPLGPGHAFRSCTGAPYQRRWKKLDAKTVEDYYTLARKYGVQP